MHSILASREPPSSCSPNQGWGRTRLSAFRWHGLSTRRSFHGGFRVNTRRVMLTPSLFGRDPRRTFLPACHASLRVFRRETRLSAAVFLLADGCVMGRTLLIYSASRSQKCSA